MPAEMIYYFVGFYGTITEEVNIRNWHPIEGSTFASKKKAVAEAKRRIKERIAELKKELEALK